MSRRQRFATLVIAVVGSIGSVLALGGFLLRMLRNELPAPAAPTMQAFYQMVGDAYSGGFVHGFSLCFFLTLLAVAIASWLPRDPAFRT